MWRHFLLEVIESFQNIDIMQPVKRLSERQIVDEDSPSVLIEDGYHDEHSFDGLNVIAKVAPVVIAQPLLQNAEDAAELVERFDGEIVEIVVFVDEFNLKAAFVGVIFDIIQIELIEILVVLAVAVSIQPGY